MLTSLSPMRRHCFTIIILLIVAVPRSRGDTLPPPRDHDFETLYSIQQRRTHTQPILDSGEQQFGTLTCACHRTWPVRVGNRRPPSTIQCSRVGRLLAADGWCDHVAQISHQSPSPLRSPCLRLGLPATTARSLFPVRTYLLLLCHSHLAVAHLSSVVCGNSLLPMGHRRSL